VILFEINNYEKVQVEFVSGATPTVHLFDEDGNDIDQFILGDLTIEEVLKLFSAHGFPLLSKNQIEKDMQPSSITDLNSIYYELYATNVNYDDAKAFAANKKKRGTQGRLLTYNCSFQEAHIRKWLSGFKVTSVWLGSIRDTTANKFKWAEGPLMNIQNEGNASQYSNWAPGEPNNAGSVENCAIQNLKEYSGWNDVNCIGQISYVVLEYGSTVVPCVDPLPEEKQNHPEKYDPNFKVKYTGLEVDL